jgi:hypothetical protein
MLALMHVRALFTVVCRSSNTCAAAREDVGRLGESGVRLRDTLALSVA